jgi:fructose-specific phosphotransferase system IIC component
MDMDIYQSNVSKRVVKNSVGAEVSMVSGFIAVSIADRPAMVGAVILGMIKKEPQA